MYINTSAMSKPIFKQNSMTLVVNGEIANSTYPIPFRDKRKINYNINDTDGNVQLYIGDYLYNSAFYTAWKLNLTNYRIASFSGDEVNDPIKPSTLKYIFPNITNKMPKDPNIVIFIVADDCISNLIKVKENLTDIKLNANISFAEVTEDDSYREFIRARSNFTLESVTEIKEPFEIDLDIRTLKINQQLAMSILFIII